MPSPFTELCIANQISIYKILCLFVCLSALRHRYMNSKVNQVRIFRYHSKFFLDTKFTVRTIRHVFTFRRGSNDGFRGQSRGKQCSFISLSALLTAQTLPVIEWNSTTIDNVLVEGDNMYLNAFNNDLIPREGFLSLNNLPTVVCY